MLSLAKCREIIQSHVDEINLTSDVEMDVFDKVQQGEFCFAFTINSVEFIRTGNFDFCYVGAGPTLVDRRTSKVIEMANNGSMENYEKRGDPHNYLSYSLSVIGSYQVGKRREAIKFIREVTGKTIAVCQDTLDKMSESHPFIFEPENWDKKKLSEHIGRFRELGFNVRRLTSFEVREVSLGDNQAASQDTI